MNGSWLLVVNIMLNFMHIPSSSGKPETIRHIVNFVEIGLRLRYAFMVDTTGH